MSLREKTKFLWQRSEIQTGFKTFREYFYLFLGLAGFNVLQEDCFVGYKRQFILIFVAVLPVTGFISSFHIIWRFSDQIEEVVVSTITWIMMFQVANKLIELASHRQSHREMIKIVTENTEKLQDNEESREIGIRNFNRARVYIFLSTVSYLAALVSLWAYPIYPLLTRGEYKLGSNVELPGTNHKERNGWIVNYSFSILLTSTSAFLVLAYDILFYIYVFYITGRFEVLGNRFQLIGDFSSAYNTEEKQQELIIKCIEIHADILAFARKCSELFSTVYLFVSLSDFVVICIALFHLQLDKFASSGFIGVAAVIQSFIFSNCGQVVRMAAEEASIALYTSNWYQLKRIDQRKMILLLLTQSQKDLGFTAGGFPVSLELFKSVSAN